MNGDCKCPYRYNTLLIKSLLVRVSDPLSCGGKNGKKYHKNKLTN